MDSFHILLVFLLVGVSCIHGPSYTFPIPVLQLDLGTPNTLPSIALPYVNQNDGSFMMSIYMRVNQVP